MKAALAVPTTTTDWHTNLQNIATMASSAAEAGASIIFFSEAALTGLVNSGNDLTDLALGQPIPGPATLFLADTARTHQIWVGFGLLEREDDRLYDTYVILDSDGLVAHQYRRIDPHWHHWANRPTEHPTYACGTVTLPICLPFGSASILLCGDLFNYDCLEQVKRNQTDWLVVPMARGFASEINVMEEWHTREKFAYIEQAVQGKTGLILVNQLASFPDENNYFGGALVARRSGEIIAELSPGSGGLLMVEIR